MSKYQANQVLEFWFEELSPEQWWIKDPALDQAIKERFGLVLDAAARCELADWRETAEGRLAEIIVLDQFSRQIHRGSAAAFACDPLALALAQHAVAMGADKLVDVSKRRFMYLPFMHSESLQIHEQAMILFSSTGDPVELDFEIRHKEIIERFGRYPHRNEALGRVSTNEELDYLSNEDAGF